jgi:predicted permease
MPGISSATLVENALVSGWISNTNVEIDGETGQMHMNAVGPGFFETMGLPLIAGRALDERDHATAPRAVVINETAARRWFPGQPVGHRFVAGGDPVEVVGVVADSTYESLRRPVDPTFYDSYLQRDRGPGAMFVMFRAGVPPGSLGPAIRDAVLGLDRQVPVTAFRTQVDQIDETTSRERVFARLLVVFGGFTLLLASIGLHGVTAHSVSRRTNEIGVRLALGAQRSQILWLMLSQVVVLTAAGLAAGLLGAWLAGPVIGSMLFGVEPGDPTTLAAAAGTLFVVAVLAGWLPARRAAAMDALTALGRE